MRSEDHMTARAYPFPDEYEAEGETSPPLPNAFTPISAATRFAQRPRRTGKSPHVGIMPPLTPGQSYFAPQEDRPLYWEDAFEEDPLKTQYQPPSPPPQPGYGYPEDADIFRAEPMGDQPSQAYDGMDYAQEAMQPEGYVPGGGIPFPAYFEDYSARANPPPYPYGYELPPTGYEPSFMGAPALHTGYREEPIPSEWPKPSEGERKNSPRTVREAPLPKRPAKPVRQVRKAPLSLRKTAATCVITLMLVFCLVEVGKIALSMMRNEAEMKTIREEYLAQAGVDLTQNATMVELLPPGVTFTPTATPAPITQPALEAEIPAATDVSTQNQRSKTTSYAENPLCNVLPAFESLLKENADITGRLTIDGLLSAVVVQRNNTYYLTHNAQGGFSASGAVFVDESCSIKSPPENLLLRGQSGAQNMPFAALSGYESGGAGFVRQHGLIQMDTLYEEGQYVVFAVIRAGNDSQSSGYFNYAGYPSFQSDWQMDNHIVAAKTASLYDIPVDVQASDRLLTLSTLGDGAENDCLVILARKIRPGESVQSLNAALNKIQAR